jgi:eukaryotic-like serine/threonine-protein kinase
LTITAGTSINQYKIITSLGSGGMGEVYLAQDVRLGRKVALKLLYDDGKHDEDWVRRFEQEARATSSLNHPNIITIYEVGQQADGSHFISAEFIDGQTLRERLKNSIMSLREALDIAIQVAMALATAHEAGIVHRDIKPENVMLRSDGYVKVVDFGLAKFMEKRILGLFASDPDAETQPQGQGQPSPYVKTNPGTVMGTVSYMSPEQASGAHVDARSDIFSLGILLYEMLTGHLPFGGSTASEVIIAIIQKRHPPMARFSPDVPVEMERIVGKALSKNREERYQTIKDMLLDLKSLKRGLEIEAETGDLSEQELLRKLLGVSGGSSSSNRGSGSGGGGVSSSPQQPSVNTAQTLAPTMPPTIPTTTSSAEYIVKGLKQHKRIALIVAGALVVALAALYYYRATRPIDSIAVLPFVDVNLEPGAKPLSDDITAKLINSLSKSLPNLRVVPFSDVMRFKGQTVSAQEAGLQLGVRVVLTGRVTKSGDLVTIGAELVDIRDNRLLWGDTPATRFSDITLTVQSIVATISDKIGMSAEDEKKREAESLYMKGRNAWNKRTGDAIKEAMGYFKQALALDSKNARAYAGLADSYNMLATYGASAPKEAFPEASDAATRALAIDNNLDDAHAALAYAKFRGEWKWRKAEDEFKEAIRLNPKNASAHQWYSNYLAAMSRFPEAIKETQLAQELDTTSLIIQSNFGLIYFLNGRFDDSIKSCQRAIELDPNFFAAHRYLGLAYAQKGMDKEALEHADKALELSKNSPLMRAERASVLALSGNEERAKSELKELQEMAKQRYISAYHIAAIYAALKDERNAFEWLEQAFTEGADWMVYLKVDPRFSALRSDSRFTELLRRMDLK